MAVGERYDHHRGVQPLLRPTGRLRSAIFLGVNLIGFALVNAFWLYLSTGRWLDVRPSSYVADITNPTTLPDLFERTLNVLTHPWMVLVGGLLLGVVIFIPIIVSVLYRLRYAAAFVVLVAAVGHAPAMALALAIGCLLAGRTTMRSDMPFLAAMLGLLPLGLYLYLFASAGSSAVAVLPIQRWVLKAPFVVAVLSAVLAFAVVVGLAKVTRYRPGAVWPVLAIMLAGPVTVFFWKIGPAELDYQLIVKHLSPGDAVFEPVDLDTWIARNAAEGLSPQSLLQQAQGRLVEDKHRLRQECERFLRRYPRSEQAPSVAWILAQSGSLQLDRRALSEGWVKCTAAHLAPVPDEYRQDPQRTWELPEVIASTAGSWERLRRDYGFSPQAALAQWRLAELDIRRSVLPGTPRPRGEALIRQAYNELQAAREGVRGAAARPAGLAEAGRGSSVFAAPPPVPPREYYEQALYRLERLLWLMRTNDVLNDWRSAQALAAYLHVNRFGITPEEHLQQLCELAGRYEDTHMAKNLKLAVALAAVDPNRRADQLVLLAEQDEDWDTAVEAAFALGQLLLRHPSIRARPDVKPPREYFLAVREEFSNPWKELAVEQLRLLGATTRPARHTLPSTSPASRPASAAR